MLLTTRTTPGYCPPVVCVRGLGRRPRWSAPLFVVHRGNLAILNGPHWSLPVHAVDYGDLCRLRPAGRQTRMMLDALNARFAELGTFNGQDWFVAKKVFLRHGRFINYRNEPSPADDWISWTRPDTPLPALKQPDGMEGFFEEFAQAHAITPAEAQSDFGAWCQHMYTRLLRHKKPVHLGFAVLEPLPARANWRDVTVRRINNYMRGSGKKWSEATAIAQKFMTSGAMLMAHQQARRLYWTITLRHTKAWWHGVRRLEKIRKRQRARYAERYFTDALDFLKSRSEAMYACLMDYVAQVRRPWVRLRTRTLRSSRRPDKKPTLAAVNKYLRFSRPRVALDPRVGSKISALGVGCAVKKLRKMPDSGQETVDVRHDLDEPGNGTAGVERESGVCLLPPDQGSLTRE